MPTVISGVIKLLDTTTPGTSSFVRFWLRGCRGNEPRITATGAIAPQAAGSSFYVDIPADSSGNVSGSIYSTRASDGAGDGEIECGGSYKAVNYGMVIYNSGIPGPEVPVHAKQGSTLNISNVSPISTSSVIAAPTGDTTYARLDGGNSPFTGAVSFNSSVKVTGSGADSTSTEGNVYYRTDLHRLRWYDGTAWRSLIGADSTDTLTAKTLTAPTITSPTTTGTDSGAETLQNKTLSGAGNGNAVSLLNFQGVLAAVVGTGADANLFTYTIPANTVGAGKGFRVTLAFQHSTGAASVTYKLKLGSTTLLTWADAGTGASVGSTVVMNNAGVQNAQTATGNVDDAAAVTFNGFGTATENLANSAALTLTFSVAATDQVTPKFWLVELVQ